MSATTFPTSLPCPGCHAECPVKQEDCPACGMKIRLLNRHFSSPPERLRAAFALRDAGIEHYRQRMARENPQASPKAVDAMVRAWVMESPCESAPPARKGPDSD